MLALNFSVYEKKVKPAVQSATEQFFKMKSIHCSCGYNQVLNTDSTGIIGVYIFVSRGDTVRGAFMPIISETIDADETLVLFFKKLVELHNELPTEPSPLQVILMNSTNETNGNLTDSED